MNQDGATPVAKRPQTISETEMEVLRALWECGTGTVREIDVVLRASGRRWAYTTVLTLLQRLEAKGYVKRDTSGFAHVYRPAMSRDRLLRQRLSDLADQLCDGAATPLLMALVEQHRFTKQEISEFRKLLNEAAPSEPAAPKRKRKRGRTKI